MRKILILLLLLLFLSGCSESGEVKQSRAALGTIVEITVADKDKSRQFINQAIQKAFAEINRVENLFSRFKPDSEISRINAQAGKCPTTVSPETIGLIEKSIQFSRMSNGAFDITVGPLVELWNVEEKNRPLPTPEQLNQARQNVGYQNIKINKAKDSVFLTRSGMSLDLGGIATGYAVDRACGVLRQEGIGACLVNAGGDIYALGKPDKQKKWRIAIKHPRKSEAVLAILELQDKAVATSGDYARFKQINGRRFSHIINPQSAQPAQEVPASVTILAGDCVSADALSTAIFVLGPAKGMDLVEQLKNTEAIIVSIRAGKMEILLSQGLKNIEG